MGFKEYKGRKTWNISPVEKVKESKKKQNRNQEKKAFKELIEEELEENSLKEQL
jgi:hypothetical protein